MESRRRDRRQQGRAPADRHDGPRGANGALARARRRLEGARSSRPSPQRARGSPELLEAIDAHRAHVEQSGTLEERRARNLRSEVLGLATARMRRELKLQIAEDDTVAALLESVVRRETDPASAAAELLRRSRERNG